MELKPNCGSDRAWVWTTLADFADGESKPELLAIRFANAESKYNLHKFCSMSYNCTHIEEEWQSCKESEFCQKCLRCVHVVNVRM